MNAVGGGYHMSNGYFSLDDCAAFAKQTDGAHKSGTNTLVVFDKFHELHKSMQRRLRELSWDLHPHWDRSELISSRSAGCTGSIEGLALRYFRSREQAQLVERLMGRDSGSSFHPKVDVMRHPVIELRLTQTQFAVELIVPHSAWLDQQNLIGKLAVQRHRQSLRSLITQTPSDFCIGFWSGTEVDDMHLTAAQAARGKVLEDWLSTFQDGQDNLRVGVWYPTDDAALSVTNIVTELTRRVGALYNLYTFLLWTSNNDFRTFYLKATHIGMGKDHRLS